MRMQDEGAEVTVVGLKAGETYVSKSGGLRATTDVDAYDVSPHDFDAVLISAAIMCGRRTTGTLGLKDDLVSAGVMWVDKRAFRDGDIVWGAVVADIPAYCRELMAALS